MVEMESSMRIERLEYQDRGANWVLTATDFHPDLTLFVGAGLEVGFRIAGRLGQFDHVILRYRTNLHCTRLGARRLRAVDNHAQAWRSLAGWVSG